MRTSSGKLWRAYKISALDSKFYDVDSGFYVIDSVWALSGIQVYHFQYPTDSLIWYENTSRSQLLWHVLYFHMPTWFVNKVNDRRLKNVRWQTRDMLQIKKLLQIK